MKILLCVLCAALSGCMTTYSVSRTDPATGAVTSVQIRSFREFPDGVHIWYDRKKGSFEIITGAVNQNSALEQAAAQILLERMK